MLHSSTLYSTATEIWIQILFPRGNKKYLPADTTTTSLIFFGSNLCSTVNYPFFTQIIRHMVGLPIHIRSILVGLLLSDGWMSINNSGAVRFFF